jgi:hypothetical protein
MRQKIAIEAVRNGWLVYEGCLPGDATTAVHLTGESLIEDLRGRIAVHSALLEHKTEVAK